MTRARVTIDGASVKLCDAEDAERKREKHPTPTSGVVQRIAETGSPSDCATAPRVVATSSAPWPRPWRTSPALTSIQVKAPLLPPPAEYACLSQFGASDEALYAAELAACRSLAAK
jgi:hypothetical protein